MRKWIILVAKDLAIARRTRDFSMIIGGLGLLDVVIFGLVNQRPAKLVADGILWMGLLSAGMLGLSKLYAREMDHEVWTGLMLAPGGKLPLYMSKVALSVFFMWLAEMVTTPLLFAVWGELFNAPWVWVGTILAAGALGVGALGTMLASLGMPSRARGFVSPLIMVPLVLPISLLTMRALVTAQSHADVWPWFRALLAVDCIFLGLALLLIDVMWEV